MNSHGDAEKQVEKLFHQAQSVSQRIEKEKRIRFVRFIFRSFKVTLTIHETQVNLFWKKIESIFLHVFLFFEDNAWMESEAMNMHDETGELTKDLKLEAGKTHHRGRR